MPKPETRPVYPVRILLTEEEAAALRPSDRVYFAGLPFVKTRDGWALIDPPPVDDA